MVEGHETSAAILKVLKFSPRGMTVTDISRKLGYNRNLTAKNLEILNAEGKVEVRQVGAARVYSLAQRVPLSAFLCFTKNMILVLDKDLRVIQTNEQYLKLTGCTKQELIGRNLGEMNIPFISTHEALAVIQAATGKEQVVTDIRHQQGKEELFYKMEVIPTTFEGGEKGFTIVLEDITERKRYVKNMEFLARTAMELVDLPPGTDIFQYIAVRVAELLPDNPRCYINSYDELKGQFILRAVLNRAFRERIVQIVGHDIVGMIFPISEFFFAAPFFENPSTMRAMRELHFRPFLEDEKVSFYDICARQFPKEACDKILREFSLGKLFLTGIVWQEQLFGVVGIFLGPDEVLENKHAIESFLRQASIAISRRMTEERLIRSEQRFRDMVNLTGFPAAVIDRDGRYIHVNPQFTETFGYTRENIPTGKELFEEVIGALDPDMHKSGAEEDPRRTFEVMCKDGNRKTVLPRPVTLSDGMQLVTYEEK
jgi:PAS domain S-box-containing protein